MIDLKLGNCFELIDSILKEHKDRQIVFVSDPPFNIGYHYNSFKDREKKG